MNGSREPEALPVIHQQFERRPCAVAEDKDRPAEGLFPQLLAAYRRQAIDTFPKIDRLGREQNPALRSELQHQRVSKKVRTSAASGNWGSRH